MVIGALEAVVGVGMEGLPKSKVKVLIEPLKKACKNPEFSFWGGIFLLPVILNGLQEGGKVSVDFFVRTILHRWD